MELNHKSDFRKSCIKRLKFTSVTSKYYKDKIVIKKLENFINRSKAKNILLYIPLGIEVNVNPLINKLRKNKNVYVPYMEGDSFKIVKYRLPLQKKKFGIKEPNNSFLKPKKIDLAIVPVVGIDAIGKRIGYGKGMYDRFFDRISYKPTLVFTQLILCQSDKILSESYDIQADYIITN
ncbi:5-formyltetrahydrofolate cyclo-ligase [Poseidonibacter ostreae]|jgi:5-formyltetrahydrofolate cyclo-ligase|uniref:5-formyltetrahydrofolate cyclo-ligase n=1 Tax=Poseidonibacter ostreae TaxID=2654171 RepID=A0A6L4WQH7_9BACT|nr:5-formyltetrahydrofolate cyclo-ligase [Poseidonibacter ostreae]KAB7884937.1 5-formyltetrahydrofolate cyclo-ligase [Poseidonibacter ostreae]KAB7886766.1 5-formyltetrahydrofolate cyclo-ligase [Poseidonibacter ostreae]KAB7892980.1 5-formyltetrahydrofolate cyclo-ligase [Poseidonibacter ostreae]MAC83214.1 5-formyltetrahydrofolate cyclo-ligase [Arcobacter sp.]